MTYSTTLSAFLPSQTMDAVYKCMYARMNTHTQLSHESQDKQQSVHNVHMGNCLVTWNYRLLRITMIKIILSEFTRTMALIASSFHHHISMVPWQSLCPSTHSLWWFQPFCLHQVPSNLYILGFHNYSFTVKNQLNKFCYIHCKQTEIRQKW